MDSNARAAVLGSLPYLVLYLTIPIFGGPDPAFSTIVTHGHPDRVHLDDVTLVMLLFLLWPLSLAALFCGPLVFTAIGGFVGKRALLAGWLFHAANSAGLAVAYGVVQGGPRPGTRRRQASSSFS